MFDLVADVGRYPEFLPWCLAARVTAREHGMLRADLVVGKGPFRETFTSKVTLDAGDAGEGAGPPRIDVEYVNGPMREMANHWVFRCAPGDGGGTEIDFLVEFEFKSRLIDAVMAAFFEDAVMRMVDAFEARSDVLYGAGAGEG